jgi:hypothetical protein
MFLRPSLACANATPQTELPWSRKNRGGTRAARPRRRFWATLRASLAGLASVRALEDADGSASVTFDVPPLPVLIGV